MPYAFVEPHPKGQPDGAPITHYVLELANGARMDQNNYKTRAEAVAAARAAYHTPLIARIQNADKGQMDHWQPAEQMPTAWRSSPWRRKE